MVGQGVQNNGKRKPAVRRRVLKETQQRVNATGRSPDADEHQAVTSLIVNLLHNAQRLTLLQRSRRAYPADETRF
jgi:hypothetical protein